MLKKILFVPDTHVPYHDKKAFALMLKAMRVFKPDIVALLGDFADFYTVSSHSKDPKRAFKLEEELFEVQSALKQLKSLGAKKYVFVAGNHEDRLQRYMQDRAPELNHLINIPNVLGLGKDWEYVPYRSDYRLGSLYLTHDTGSAGRNSIFKCLDSYQHSNVTGHTHRIAYIVEGNAAGEQKIAVQFGWLGDTEAADYMHRMKARKDWSLGFGIGYLDTVTGYVYMVPVPIVNYTCLVEGVLYK